jgi:hypothetical protein
MMYWTMRNDELATKQAELPQAGGADEGGIVLGRSRQRSHERLRRSDDESGEEMTEELNNSNNNCTDPFSQYAPLTQRHTHAGPQVLVVPSLHPCGPTASLLDYIAGLRYYEERQLYHIFLLRKRDPTFRVLFVSSLDIPCEVIGYYFRLMRSTGNFTDEDEASWRSRLVLLPMRDASPTPITKKILRHPTFLSQVRAHTSDDTGMFCVFTTGREEKIASSLRVPLLAVRKSCLHFGTKSGSREAFLHTGVPHPQGTKLCHSKRELAQEMAGLWHYLESKYQRLAHNTGSTEELWRALMPQKVVIKLDDAFSGEGNALLDISKLHAYRGDSRSTQFVDLIEEQFTEEHTRFQAVEECWETFTPKCESVGVLAEIFLDSSERDVRNPSGQACIDSDGQVHLMATHEQMMGGPDGQNYQGCVFPANSTYRLAIQASVRKVGQYLASQGAIGHFSVDFLARRVDLSKPGTPMRLVAERHTPESSELDDETNAAEANCAFDENGHLWDLHALEINLRPGGATHPIMTLNLLTDGHYDEATGLYTLNEDSTVYAGRLGEDQRHRFYVASDNVKNPAFVGMTPSEIIALFEGHPLEFDGRRATGTIFHMLSCAREYGKLGMVCIGSSPAEARAIYDATYQRLLDSRQHFSS